MLEKNLKNLEKTFPELYKIIIHTELPVAYEKTGKSLKFKNNLLFSKYSPEKEADAIFNRILSKIDVEELLIFGIANPFLLKKCISKFKLHIFIPDFSLFKLCLNFFDYTEIISNSNLIWDLENITNHNNIEIFPLKVEEKLYSDILNEIKIRLKAVSKISQPKILIVKPFYGGSLPVINYLEMNLQKFNVKIKSIESDKIFSAYQLISSTLQKKEFVANMRVKLIEFVSDMVFYAIEEFKPDIVFAIAQSPLNDKILKHIRGKNITSIFWFVEDYKLFTYWQYFAPFYDFYFVIQKDEFFHELKKIGVRNFHYLPLACEPTIHKPLILTEEEKQRYGSLISFVGAGYYNRRIFFRNLLDFDFKIWGSDWEDEIILKDFIQENGRRVSTEETVKIFNASFININLHSSNFYEGIAPDGDFVNPRTFEIAACNTFQIVDRRKYLPLHFTEGVDILTYSNENEMKHLIRDISSFPEKYVEIRENSFKRVLSEHTYSHRIKEIAQIVGFEIGKKKENFKDEKEFYLANFNTLEEITDYISKKDKVSKTETIFLLMQELKNTYLK